MFYILWKETGPSGTNNRWTYFHAIEDVVGFLMATGLTASEGCVIMTPGAARHMYTPEDILTNNP